MKKILKKFRHLSNKLTPASVYLQYKNLLRFGRLINFKNPQTFSDKLNWLKIHDKNPFYTILVDKHMVKKYVTDKLGKEYIIPTIEFYKTFDEIDFNKLPNKFVLKTTHDSGSVVICKDKNNFNKQIAKEKLNKSLKHNFYYDGREWPYKNVPPRIIVEQYMEDNQSKDLRDYKFFCFNGTPVYCQVISDRSISECVDFFDMDWKHQPFTGLMKQFPNYQKQLCKPNSFEQMKKACVILAKNIPFVRVDFYEINGKMYFGELTFYPASGFGKFYPEEWDKKIGDLLILPKK